MNSAICTIFESHYYNGVVALYNSLYLQGFRGELFSGFRGELPPCFSAAKKNDSMSWPGARSWIVSEGLTLHFLPIDTDNHLANYKPDFMLALWGGPAKEAKKMFYFDPDIILTVEWSFIDNWTDFGISLCEDVNSPLSEFHPRRMAWRKYFKEKGICLQFKGPIYANSGFIGLRSDNRDFLVKWKEIQETIAPLIGGLNRSPFTGKEQLDPADGHDYAPFSRTDQDALNATVEYWEGTVSMVGKAGMAFGPGTTLMPHAIGSPKPWHWKPVLQAISGFPPRQADREYWKFVKGPLHIHSTGLVYRRKMALKIAGLIGRFYRRS